MHPVLFQIGDFEVSSWSVCVIIGVLLLIIFYLRDIRRLGVSEAVIDRIIIVGAIAGIFVYIGCSLFDTLWHAIDIANETGKFSFFDEQGHLVGGVTFEGGIILGFLVWFLIFPLGIKKDKHHSLYYMDKLVAYIFLGHSIGRIGCFLAGCCYGKSTTSILGLMYPTDYGTMRVYPTQLIESGFLLIFFFIFRFLVKRNQTEKYLITYGLFRFFLEYLRGDNRGMVFGGIISPSQFMSLIFILGGILCIIFRRIVYHKEGNDFDKLKQQNPTLLTDPGFLQQIDQMTTKYIYDHKIKFQGFKERKSKEEIEKEYLQIDEVFNVDDLNITAPIIKYYLKIEKETKKDQFKNYFFIGEMITIILLILNTVYTTTEGISENKIIKESSTLVENYLKETLPDNIELSSYSFLYVKDSTVEERNNHLYYRYNIYDKDNSTSDTKYIELNYKTKEIINIDYDTYHDVYYTLSDKDSHILWRYVK